MAPRAHGDEAAAVDVDEQGVLVFKKSLIREETKLGVGLPVDIV
jgi:hypothetical protein